MNFCRLELDINEAISTDFNWGAVNYHEAIIPLNLSRSTADAQQLFFTGDVFNMPGDQLYHPQDAYFLDFKINMSALTSMVSASPSHLQINIAAWKANDMSSRSPLSRLLISIVHALSFYFQDEDLNISIPFLWEFDHRGPDHYSVPISVSLTPFDWDFLSIKGNQSVFDSYLIDNGLMDEFPDLSDGMVDSIFSNISNATDVYLPIGCLLVDSSYAVLSSWADVSDCSLCIRPNFSVSTSTLLVMND